MHSTRFTDGGGADRMSASDAIMWHVERDPALRSTIVVAFVLERPPRPERLAAMFDRLLRAVPRLRQRVVEDPLGLAPPRWTADPTFDRAHHVRRRRLAAPGTRRDLFDLAAAIAATPFDRARPLWEAYCVDGLEDGQGAILWKVNHALADGQGLLWILLHMVDGAGDQAAGTPPVAASGGPRDAAAAESPLEAAARLAEAIGYRLDGALQQARRAAAAWRRVAPEVLAQPLATARQVVITGASIARVLQPAFTPLSPVWRARSLASRFDELEVPLEDLRRAARRTGGTINDSFLAAVAGGLARYHARHGAAVAAVRVGMPTSIRHGDADALGNRFVPLRLTLPLRIRDPLRRQRAVAAAARAARGEPGVDWAEEVTGALTLFGGAVVSRVIGGVLKGLDLQASNLAGPPFAIAIAGVPLRRLVGFGPLAGAALNLTLLSYHGVARIGVRSDPAAVPDPDLLLRSLRAGFDEMVRAGSACGARDRTAADGPLLPERPRRATAGGDRSVRSIEPIGRAPAARRPRQPGRS